MKDDNKNSDVEDALPGLLWAVAGFVGASAVAWVITALAGFLHAGHLPHVGPLSALVAVLRVLAEGHWGDPAAAFPREARPSLPDPCCGGRPRHSFSERPWSLGRSSSDGWSRKSRASAWGGGRSIGMVLARVPGPATGI